MSVDQLKHIPEMETIAQPEPGITLGRIARKLTVEMMKRGFFDRIAGNGILPSLIVSSIVSELKGKDDGDTAWKITYDHLYPLGNRLFLLANRRVHPDMWMRDFAITSEFTDSLVLDDNVLRTFEERQRLNGQIPTAVGLVGQTPWHFADDESTLLYVTTVAQLADKGSKLTPTRREKVAAALDFIDKHVHEGMYVSPAGERRGWLDSFIYPKSDVITQNQGLYAVTLMAADKLGFPIEASAITKAGALYRGLAEVKGGYLPLSANFHRAPDISSLYPDYLAITRFGEQLLSDDVVGTTLEAVPFSKHGYKVLMASPSGEYFDPSYFVTCYPKGKYQNGGMWPIWHNNALVVGQLHGLVAPEQYREAVMCQLEKTNWPESIRTGGDYESLATPENLWQVWNVAIQAQHKIADRTVKISKSHPPGGIPSQLFSF